MTAQAHCLLVDSDVIGKDCCLSQNPVFVYSGASEDLSHFGFQPRSVCCSGFGAFFFDGFNQRTDRAEF